MIDQNSSCRGGPTLVFACSGAADVGEIADRAARKITQEGAGKMFCLAGIGGRIPGIMKATQAASHILAIDGCPLNCVKAGLNLAGVQNFHHLQLADIRMEKGKTPPTQENINQAARRGIEMLS